jgi:deoxycytidine triphosphate deaminase
MEIKLNEFQRDVSNFKLAVERSRLTAEERYNLMKDFDPYSDIAPSLLNAGHLATYACTVGMIEPFQVERLAKPATYLVAAEGPVRYMNEKRKVERFYLTNDLTRQHHRPPAQDYVRLAPNSICFLTLEPIFRMPSYIGARFNLLIRDVYRGLLVGTGPLVDPGFCGRLSIPIHNLTNREYYIRAGEGIVYFEFTKITWTNPIPSPVIPAWLPPIYDHQPPFPAVKNDRRTLDDYLTQATGGGGPPESAIGVNIAQIRSGADKAQRLLSFFTIGGGVAAIILLLTAWQVYLAAQQFTQSAQTDLRESHSTLANQLSDLKNQLDDVHSRLDKLAPK